MRVHGVGDGGARVMFVGEAPGEMEDRIGRPFVGPAGAELAFWLRRTCRLSRDEVFITNICRERPPNNRDPRPEDIARDLPDLWLELAAVNPEVVVTLGLHSTRYFLGPWASMELCGGLPHRAHVEYEGQEWAGVVVPVHHPASGLHQSEFYALTVRDFEALGAYLRGEIGIHEPDTAPTQYVEWVDLDQRIGRGEGGNVVGVDTEGSVQHPWCLTASFGERTAGLIRSSQRAMLAAFQRYIDRERPIVVIHFAPHDLRVLDAMGVHIDPSLVIDTMQLAYLIGRLPQGLKALAYRLCGMRMRDYEDLIRDHDARVARGWLERLLTTGRIGDIAARPVQRYSKKSPDTRTPEQKIFERHVRALAKFATTPSEDMLHERWERSVLAERLGIAAPMPHATLDDVPFDEVLQYACADADATRRVFFRLREGFD